MTPEGNAAALAEIRSLRAEIEAFERKQEPNMQNDPLAGLPADERQALEDHRAQRLANEQAESELQAIMRKPNADLTADDLEKLRQYAIRQGRREGWL